MKRPLTQLFFRWRMLGWVLSCIALSLLLAPIVAASQHGVIPDQDGAASYIPTRGEWLCLVLNTQRALTNSEHTPRVSVIHFLYDRSRPNVVVIQVLSDLGANREQVRRCTARAERQAAEAAKTYGWQGWLKIEREEQQLTDVSTLKGLIR